MPGAAVPQPSGVHAKRQPTAHAISFQDEREAAAEGTCREEIETFHVSGLSDPAMERDVNRLFSPQKLAMLTSWTRACPDGVNGLDGCGPTKAGRVMSCPSTYPGQPIEASTSATVKYLDAKLLSVELVRFGDTGGAHPFYSVSGLNIDLEQGTIQGLEGWVSAGVDMALLSTLGAREADDDEEPFYELSAYETARLDEPTLGGYSEAYFTEEALFLIPSVPEVARHQRGNHRRIPWKEIASHVPPTSPLRPLVDRAR